MPDRFAHCTFCGARFTPGQAWPRHCAACGETSYQNPKPVAVAVLPVGAGLLVVRRGIPPAHDTLALPGGYIEMGETWQEAAVRELREEVGVQATTDGVRLLDAISAPDGTLLLFALLPPFEGALPPSAPNQESLGWQVIETPTKLGFDLHTQVADRWFADSTGSTESTGSIALRPATPA